MNVDTRRRFRWPIVASVLGAIFAAAVFLFTEDVIWALVPLLLMVAVVRRLARHEAGRDSPGDRMQKS
jgi:hypothetical protein